MATVVAKQEADEEEYTIKPQASTPAVDTSEWPLLLKDYNKLVVKPDDADILLSGTLLRLDQSCRAIETDDETARNLGV